MLPLHGHWGAAVHFSQKRAINIFKFEHLVHSFEDYTDHLNSHLKGRSVIRGRRGLDTSSAFVPSLRLYCRLTLTRLD